MGPAGCEEFKFSELYTVLFVLKEQSPHLRMQVWARCIDYGVPILRRLRQLRRLQIQEAARLFLLLSLWPWPVLQQRISC